MEPLQMPSEEEIKAAYDQGKESVVALFYGTFQKMAEHIQQLEDRVAKDSSNSGKPPSSDGLAKIPKSLRHKSGKKSGGQLDHPGSTLKAVTYPDYIEVHAVKRCHHCEASLESVATNGCEKRQVFDLPPVQVEVTEHQAEIKECPICHQTSVGNFPADVSQPVQYGKRIKAQMVYFNQQHHVPLERTAEIIEDLYDQTVSEGTIVEACAQVAKRVAPVNQACKEELHATTGTAHFDETGGRVEKKLWWLHVVCTNLLTYYAVHRHRGSKALDEIGIFPVFKGTAMHDSYRSYFQYDTVHNALCNAHHLRDLIFIFEQYHQTWAEEMKALLLEIKDAVAAAQPNRDALLPAQIAAFETRYDAIVAAGLMANLLPAPVEPLPKNVVSPNNIPPRTWSIISSFVNRKHWLLCVILRCHLTIIRRNAISAWSNSNRKCPVAFVQRTAPKPFAKSAVTFPRPVRMVSKS